MGNDKTRNASRQELVNSDIRGKPTAVPPQPIFRHRHLELVPKVQQEVYAPTDICAYTCG